MTARRAGFERFHSPSVRFGRVVRRFSAAFAAAKPPLKGLRSTTSAPLAILMAAKYAGLKARTTRTGRYSNPGYAFEARHAS